MGISNPQMINGDEHEPSSLLLPANQEEPSLHENNKKPKSTTETILCQGYCTTTPESALDSGVVVVDEGDDDGFRTPTSLGHRIPEIRPCPRPPRRGQEAARRWRRRKRGCCDLGWNDHRVLLDLSKEVESMFPDKIQANFGRKIKRARST